MVCLVVPSTEIRVLTALGVNWWARLDRAARVDDELPEASSAGSRNPQEHLPALLITDQRYSGTRRYYYDDGDERYHGYKQFITSFWQDELRYEIKTSPRKSYTNQAGVRILTAESFDTELLVSTVNESACNLQQQQQQQHALILFLAPTCGHCKRFLVIWNNLAQLLQHIGWNAFLTLYQVDVTENDIATTLNVTADWLPDLYYLRSSNNNTIANAPNKMIRYSHTDAVGDGVGAVRDSTEILEWLVHLDDFASGERASQLLSNLQHRQNEIKTP